MFVRVYNTPIYVFGDNCINVKTRNFMCTITYLCLTFTTDLPDNTTAGSYGVIITKCKQDVRCFAHRISQIETYGIQCSRDPEITQISSIPLFDYFMRQ